VLKLVSISLFNWRDIMGKKRRKNWTAQEKVGILKRHFVEKKAISDLCDEYNMHPTVFLSMATEFL